MIYVTGDTHGRVTRFAPGSENFMHDMTWRENDTLIVCGDFGFVFLCDLEEKLYLDYLEKKPYTICFCDGNHENHKKLAEYPVEEWKGGKIHRIRKNIIHLMRGQIYEIEGKRIFSMGGAYSIDRALRQPGYSYWEEELPSQAEYNEAVSNLKRHSFKVDYIVSHTAPREIILHMGFDPDPHDCELTGFLEYVMYETKDSMKKWFFGHWHEDRELYEGRFRALLNDVVKII